MSFKNPSIVSQSITRTEFDELKERVDEIANKIDSIKVNETEEQNYKIVNNLPNKAFLTGAPRIEIIKSKTIDEELEILEPSSNFEDEIIPIEKLYGKSQDKNYIIKNEIPNTAEVNGSQRTYIVNSSVKQKQMLPNIA